MALKASVLVVAHITAVSDELLDALRARAEQGPVKFTVLVPAGAAGRAGREAARERLDAALERMRGVGLEVEGRVGPPDPATAVHQAWDPASFDEVVVSTLPTGSSKWLQVDLPHRVERMTGAPVTHVVASEPRKPPPVGQPPPPEEKLGVLAPFAPLTWAQPGSEEEEPGRRSRR